MPRDPAARRTAARAFIGQALKPGRAWATKAYAYDYQEDGMDFLAYYEDSPKKPLALRLAEAVQAYRDRLGVEPNLILVSEHDAGAVYPGCEVTALGRVGVNCYHVGRQEG